MSLHYTLLLNAMTNTPEYRDNAVGYMITPLDQAVRKSFPWNGLSPIGYLTI